MTTQQYRILYVEDDPVDVRLFGMLLDGLDGHEHVVHHATTLGAALEVLEAAEIDLVFLDLDLPDSEGLATVERVLAAGADVPIVVMTGHRDEEMGVRAVSLGAQDYLVKDTLHPAMVGRVLRYAVGRQRVLDLTKRESARTAAAVARTEATDEARSNLAREIAERESAQSRLELSLTRLRALRGVAYDGLDRLPVERQLGSMLDAVVPLVPVDAAVTSVVRGDELVAAATRGLEAYPELGLPVPVDDVAVQTAWRRGPATFVLEPGDAPPEVPFARAAAMRRAGMCTYHVVALRSGDQHVGVLELYARASMRQERPDWFAFVEAHCTQVAAKIDARSLRMRLVSANSEVEDAYDSAIDGWARALDLRDHDTMGHSRRVADLALDLARRLGLSEDRLADLRRGALLHDIGKIAVPDAILRKAGPLDRAERAVMERHTIHALELLEPIAFLRPALEVPYAHHERWDGSGYPLGLAGDRIPLPARIFAVADVFDALTWDRPYRGAWSVAEARDYIADQAGRLFDPEVAAAFLAM